MKSQIISLICLSQAALILADKEAHSVAVDPRDATPISITSDNKDAASFFLFRRQDGSGDGGSTGGDTGGSGGSSGDGSGGSTGGDTGGSGGSSGDGSGGSTGGDTGGSGGSSGDGSGGFSGGDTSGGVDPFIPGDGNFGSGFDDTYVPIDYDIYYSYDPIYYGGYYPYFIPSHDYRGGHGNLGQCANDLVTAGRTNARMCDTQDKCKQNMLANTTQLLKLDQPQTTLIQGIQNLGLNANATKDVVNYLNQMFLSNSSFRAALNQAITDSLNTNYKSENCAGQETFCTKNVQHVKSAAGRLGPDQIAFMALSAYLVYQAAPEVIACAKATPGVVASCVQKIGQCTLDSYRSAKKAADGMIQQINDYYFGTDQKQD